MTRRGTHQRGKGRAGMRPDTSRPRKTYVSGRSTDTRSKVTREHTWLAGSRKTERGRGGGVNSQSCHREATKRRAGRWGGAKSTPW